MADQSGATAPSLELEARRTSFRFTPNFPDGRPRRLYLSLSGKDGDPKGYGKALGRVFTPGDKLTLLRTADLEALRGAARERAEGPPKAVEKVIADHDALAIQEARSLLERAEKAELGWKRAAADLLSETTRANAAESALAEADRHAKAVETHAVHEVAREIRRTAEERRKARLFQEALRAALANRLSAGVTSSRGEGEPDRCRACLARFGHDGGCWVPLARRALASGNAPETNQEKGAAAPHSLDGRRGLYRKYEVRRLNDVAGKHAECTYYVLDLVHDIIAIPAIRAYADACALFYPELAADLRAIISTSAPRHDEVEAAVRGTSGERPAGPPEADPWANYEGYVTAQEQPTAGAPEKSDQAPAARSLEET